MTQVTAYAHPLYSAVEGLQFKTIQLAASGGQLMLRVIPGTGLNDARAPYPFLVCHDWSRLADDLETLPSDLVSVTAVTDPFAEIVPECLTRAFPQLVRPYKSHLIIDLKRPLESFADPHHLGCARRALRKLEVDVLADPLAHLDDWLRLYNNLVERHGIVSHARMSENSFKRLYRIPGLTVFRARWQGSTIGMIMCMDDGERVYFHLGAYDEVGYRRNASYAIVRSAIDHFTSAGRAVMNIGAGAGVFNNDREGLTSFKRGWASSTRLTYLCGRIHNPDNYAELMSNRSVVGNDYFPAYRSDQYSG